MRNALFSCDVTSDSSLFWTALIKIFLKQCLSSKQQIVTWGMLGPLTKQIRVLRIHPWQNEDA
jgi:hypothetical protein